MKTEVTAHTANQNRDFYDAEAGQYDELRYASAKGRRVDVFHRQVLSALCQFGERRFAAALEVGCGTGRLLQFVADYADDVQGIDASEGMLGVAKDRLESAGAGNVEVSKQDALNLQFPDSSFDLVYSVLVVNLIPNFADLFVEIRRVLRDDGVFVFSIPNLESIYFVPGAVVNARGKAFGTNTSGHRHSHWFVRREIDEALNGAGLARTATLGQPPWVTLLQDASPVPADGLGRFLCKSLFVRAVVAQ